MTQKLHELDRREQIRQVLQWFKDDPYLLQCYLDDPDDALAQLKDSGQEMSEDAARQLKSLIFERGGFEDTYNRFFPDESHRSGGSAPSIPAPSIKGGGQKGTPERIVSTGFADEGDAATPYKPELPLRPATNYYFWFEVGAPVEGSIEVVPTELPEEIPPGAELDVALFSFENELGLTEGKDIGRIKIESDGTVTVLIRVAEPAVGEALLNKRLFFPVKTADRERPQRLRCNIYYKQTLIQSRLVSVKVSANPEAGNRPALASHLDYTLSKSLDGEVLEGMGTNQMSVMLNDNGNGTHGFRFFGQQSFKNDASLTEGELINFLDMARGALRQVAWGSKDEYSGQSYRYEDREKDVDRLRRDLYTLAKAGRRFYTGLMDKLAGGQDVVFELQNSVMRQPGQVQIASKVDARLVVPAAMFYDARIDDGKDSSEIKLCDVFSQALSNGDDLASTVCFQGDCPNKKDKLVVCPSGFWGFRHSLGLPVSIKGSDAEGDDASVVIKYSGTPYIAMNVSTDKNFKALPQHENNLRSLGLANQTDYANNRDAALSLIEETRAQVVYFYCHGGLGEDGLPYLLVGDPLGDWLTTTNVFDLERIWTTNRPLVFINGCHTAALTPKYALNFVKMFIQVSNAAGVIGTEITIYEPIATAFGEECLKQFLKDGKTLGEAVRGARLKMLQDGNPLGLVYIPYAVPGLKVVAA